MSVNWGSMSKTQKDVLQHELTQDCKAIRRFLRSLCYAMLWIGCAYAMIYWVLIHSSYHIKH